MAFESGGFRNFQQPMEEIIEYMWLKPGFTNLNVDVFADDGQAYLRHNHNLQLLVRNGYGKSIDEFIPFLVSDNPVVLDKTMELNISEDDISCVKEFIVGNLDNLRELADRKISQSAFVGNIKISSYPHLAEKR